MQHSTGKPTKAQQARLDRVHAMQCLACDIEKIAQPLPTEAHHLVDRGTRKHSGGHDATIPLCKWHHRGERVEYMTGREMHLVYGPSLALKKREFIACYGTERELLALTDERMKQDEAA